MIMEPLTILGALFGSFLNRILPEFVLILLLAIVLAATANRTVSKGFALWAKESKENKTKATGGAYSKVASEEDVERALTTRGGGSAPFSWGVTSGGPPGGRSLSKDGTHADSAKYFCRLVGVYYAGNLISDLSDDKRTALLLV